MARENWKIHRKREEEGEEQNWLAHTGRPHKHATHPPTVSHTHLHALVRSFLRTCSIAQVPPYPTSWPRDFSFYLPTRRVPFVSRLLDEERCSVCPSFERLRPGQASVWQYAVELGRVWEEDACDML